MSADPCLQISAKQGAAPPVFAEAGEAGRGLEVTAMGRKVAKVAVAKAVYAIDRPYDYLVPAELEERLPGKDIPLVARMNKMNPIPFIQLLLPPVNHAQNLFCVLSCKGLQRI